MKKRKSNQAAMEGVRHKSSITQQVMALILGLCLAVVSIPTSQSGISVKAAQAEGPAVNSGLSEDVEGQELGGKFSFPEGFVTETDGRKKDATATDKSIRGKKTVAEDSGVELEEDTELPGQLAEPGCGIITEDTVWGESWSEDLQLCDGELVVMPGVTLTICDMIEVRGRVTVKGGGTIARGQTRGHFSCEDGAELTFEDITLDGRSYPSNVCMVSLIGNNNLTIGEGCVIKDWIAQSGGGAIYIPGNNSNITINRAVIENCKAKDGLGGNGGAIYCPDGRINNKITLNDATIRNCSAGDKGGAIYVCQSEVIINGGLYENNRTTDTEGLTDFYARGITGGGFLFNCMSNVTINGGIFSGNSSVTKGGCIHHCGHRETRTYINGGTFLGNTCTNQPYLGSGGLYHSAVEQGDTSVVISDGVVFGDGEGTDGTDGIFLESRANTPRKILISDSLTHPLTLYLKAVEHYVLAEGIGGYRISKKGDMKKIHFVDVSDSGDTWYTVLDEENNQVYLSTEDPGYGYFVNYHNNGAEGSVVTDDTEYKRGDKVTVKSGEGLRNEGYNFAGWNTKEDGSGVTYQMGDVFEMESDTDLYAVWEVEVVKEDAPYQVEHYKQDIEGSGYTRVDDDTQNLTGKIGTTVEAEANAYGGFHLNTASSLGKTSGTIEADGSLVLQLYYDRDVYEAAFDLNGGEGTAPEMQSVRYGGFLQEPREPQRRGYTFKGWYMDAEGTESGYWDFLQTVDKNTAAPKIILYAKWADEIAPILGTSTFDTQSRSFQDWVIGQKKLIITVPVKEEGSGLLRGDFRLEPENGKVKQGVAAIRMHQGWTTDVRARSGGLAAVMTLHGDTASGQYVAEVTIAEDFKGRVYLTCTDNAGNISVEKVLTADGAGAVVEDNAPDIRFSKSKEGTLTAGRPEVDVDNGEKLRASIDVTVSDSAGEKVTAGLAAVSYRLDGSKTQSVGKGEFTDSMVEEYAFTVQMEGEGQHLLEVTATDNAGNKSTRRATVTISRKAAAVTPGDKTPPGTKTPSPQSATGEPATGENTSVKIFATLGMVAGFTYLLLYFKSADSGFTEGEKEEILSRLVRWARRGKLRKFPALIIISLFLVYYHSIGRGQPAVLENVADNVI